MPKTYNFLPKWQYFTKSGHRFEIFYNNALNERFLKTFQDISLLLSEVDVR